MNVWVAPGCWVTLTVDDNGPGAVVCQLFNRIHPFDRTNATKECQVFTFLVTRFPVRKIKVIGHNPLIVPALPIFFALVVMHPGVRLKDAKAIRHQCRITNPSLNMVMLWEFFHQDLMGMAKWMTNNVIWFQAFPHFNNQTFFKHLMTFAAKCCVIPMKISFLPISIQFLKFLLTQNGYVFSCTSLATFVAVFNNVITIRLHHLGKAHCFPREGTV